MNKSGSRQSRQVEAGAAAGGGRRTASVWRLLFSQSVGVEESGRSGAPGPGSVLHIHGSETTSDRQAGAEQHGAVRAAGTDRDLLPQKTR